VHWLFHSERTNFRSAFGSKHVAECNTTKGGAKTVEKLAAGASGRYGAGADGIFHLLLYDRVSELVDVGKLIRIEQEEANICQGSRFRVNIGCFEIGLVAFESREDFLIFKCISRKLLDE